MNDSFQFGIRHFKMLITAGAVACLIALSLFMSSDAAETSLVNLKLSGTLQPEGDVLNHTISPNSQWVAYVADADTDEAFELFVAPTTGTAAPRRMSGLLPSGSGIRQFAWTPDSSQVVFIAAGESADVDELFVVPVSGGPPLKLNNSPFPSNADVDSFKISPDGSRVVYRANASYPYRDELYSVPIGGGPEVKISGPLNLGLLPGGVTAYDFSPDGLRVVYIAEQDAKNRFELFSTLPDGSGVAVKLNGSMPTEGDVKYFAFSPDSSRVVYVADQQTDEVFELYSVPIADNRNLIVRLNGPLVAGGDVVSFQISPDSDRVVYDADQQTDEVFELYSVPIGFGGGAAVKLNGALDAGGDVVSFRISPDSSRVVYRADQQTDNVYELYSVSIGGGAPVKPNGLLVAGGDVVSFRISPDSSRVVYRADQETDEVYELYSVPIGGGAPVKLNGLLVAGQELRYFEISPDGDRVIYWADQDTSGVFELYSVPIGGGAPVKLNGPIVAGGYVTIVFRISPDGRVVIYLADQDTVGKKELYASFEDASQTQWFTYLPSVLNR